MEPLASAEPQLEDQDGFLVEMSSWSRDRAEDLARRNDIWPLSEDHWKIIEFVQSYYKKHGEGPPIVKIAAHTGFSGRHICQLFPCGVARGAYRLAGLPRPSGCL
jgi:tRNA 2-thiouridine synthesizing protein E